MAALILPSRRVVQPQGLVEIDWGNPLARGLRLAINGSGETFYSAKQNGPTKNLTFNQRATAKGLFTTNVNSGYLSGPGRDLIAPDSTEFTVLGLFALNATGQTNKYIGVTSNTGGFSQIAVIYGFAANTIEFYAAGHTGANPRTGTGLTVSDTNPHVFCYAYQPGRWVGALDGRIVNSQSATFSLPSTALQTLYSSESGGDKLNGSIGLWLTFSRALSDTEIRALSENPWQLFKPIERRIWVGAAGGGPVTLVTADAAHAQTAGNLTLATTTATGLTVAASAHAQTADALTLTAATALTVASAAHAQTAESLTLTAATGLSLADAAHAQTADPLTLTTASALALDNAAHAQAADNLALSTTGAASLTVANASHAQTTDALALTSATAITVNSAAHAQAAGNITLASVESLVVASAAHAQTVDNVLLVIGGIGLAVDSAAHAQTAENIAPSTDSFLVVADASHGQTADLLTLSTASFFAIDGATHAQTADNLSLDGVPTLQVGSALHAQAADALALTSDSWLAVADALHAQRADNLTLVAVGDVVYTRAPAGEGFSRAPLATARDPRQTAGRTPRR